MADDARPSNRRAALVSAGEHAGQRIDNFLVRELKDVPKSRIYRMIRRGEVRVNGGRIKPTYRLKVDDQVRIPPHFARESNSQPFVDPRHLDRLEHWTPGCAGLRLNISTLSWLGEYASPRRLVCFSPKKLFGRFLLCSKPCLRKRRRPAPGVFR